MIKTNAQKNWREKYCKFKSRKKESFIKMLKTIAPFQERSHLHWRGMFLNFDKKSLPDCFVLKLY